MGFTRGVLALRMREPSLVLIGYCTSNIIANGWTLALTWAKTYRLRKEAQRLHISFPITSMLFKDGSLQFCVLTFLNVIEVIWALLRTHNLQARRRDLHPHHHPLLISHFILNLRQVDLVSVPSGVSADSSRPRGQNTLSSVMFASSPTSFVGNLGAPLRTRTPDEDEHAVSDCPSSSHGDGSDSRLSRLQSSVRGLGCDQTIASTDPFISKTSSY
ncbi:hypothetical protein BXZ70DRAFT_244368 [Cristinia sonorae]|uniref:Uncharacterized protein n=1 Tax=Cristinia sonorae TaxID=1940300 RepID=A0A8K0UY22_9AGAR|nr:hypothetical protein BXZ70DRAFT_244368 [Cristinia sonorae]